MAVLNEMSPSIKWQVKGTGLSQIAKILRCGNAQRANLHIVREDSTSGPVKGFRDALMRRSPSPECQAGSRLQGQKPLAGPAYPDTAGAQIISHMISGSTDPQSFGMPVFALSFIYIIHVLIVDTSCKSASYMSNTQATAEKYVHTKVP